MARTILIVDNNINEVTALTEYLSSEYEVIPVSDGREMLSVLSRGAKSISAILLNLVLPDMDGYELLRTLSQNAVYSQIPVIVATEVADEDSQVKAMSLGANGYVFKPFNKALLVHTLENAINLREKSALLNTFRRDELTGLLNRKAFFETVEAMIKRREQGYYILACVDIEKFKVINDEFGIAVGDEVLKHVAEKLNQGVQALGGTCCRYTADKFGMLYPAKYKDTEALNKLLEDVSTGKHLGRSVRIRIGRYSVNDLSVPVSAMYDRATLAEESIRGRYDTHIAEYNPSMRAHLLNEQKITNDMSKALPAGEFEPWFQPQYNHATGALTGAEALVRWNRDGEYIPPSEFIPIFERNGFIYEMDKYIWEQVCILLRRWLDEGSTPLPVSVNISRRDLFHEHFIETLVGIVKKYNIPIELLHLEVTESAFAEETGRIIAKVGQLIKMGFTVAIDDFGSGYSSLNTLKDVPASILKLDMKFFENTGNQQRSGNIVESVVRMAKWLDMTVVAEGVENKEQADYLRSIGCNYIQGFIYAKPMPADSYEKLLKNSAKEPKRARLQTLKNLDNNEFWNPQSMETLIFNSYVGGACIFEYYNGQMELLRVNEQYAHAMGELVPDNTCLSELSPVPFLDEDNKKQFFDIIHSAIDTGKEAFCELKLVDRTKTPPREEHIRITARVIAKSNDRYLFYSVIVNTTRRHVAEKKQLETSRRLQLIMDSINGGVSAIRINDDATSSIVFSNDRYYELYGYTRQQAEEEGLDVMELILPEDLPMVMEKVRKLKTDREPAAFEYRSRKKDGSIAYISLNASMTHMGGYDDVITSVIMDVTELRMAQRKVSETAEKLSAVLNHAGNGITALALHNRQAEYLFANDRFFEIIGYTREEYFEKARDDAFTAIHPDDKEQMRCDVTKLNKSGGSGTFKFRVLRPEGKTVWVKTAITITKLSGVDVPVQISMFSDISAETEANDQLLFLNEAAHNMLSQPDSGAAVNDTLEKLREYFGADRAYVFELDSGKKVCSNTYERCAAGVESEIELLQNIPYEQSIEWFGLLMNDDKVIVKRVEELGEDEKALRALLKVQNIQSLYIAPLHRDGTLMGYVGIDNPKKEAEQLGRLRALGDYIAVLLLRRDLSAKIESDQRMMKALMDDTPGGYVRMRLDSSGKFIPVYSNAGLQELFGMSKPELHSIFGKDALAGVHPEDKELVNSAGQKMLAEGKAQSARFRVKNGKGDYVWMTLYGRCTKDADGETYLNVYYSDATQQVREEGRKKGTESLQKELLDNLPTGAALYEYDGKNISVIHINKSYWKLVERPPVDYSAASPVDMIYPEDRVILIQEIEAAIRQKRDVDVNIRIRCGMGEYKPFRIRAGITQKPDGRYLFFTSYTPISDREMSVQEMLPIALSTMMSASEEISFVKDRDLRYICCSRSFAKAFGYESHRELIGKTASDLMSEKYARICTDNDNKVLNSGSSMIDATETIPYSDGTVRVVTTSKYPILDTAGKVIGLYGVTRDITKQHEKESQLELLTSTIPGGLAAYAVADGRIRMLYFNDGYYKFSGCSREEYAVRVADDPLAFVFDEDKPVIQEMLKNLNEQEDGHVNGCEYRCHSKNGGYRWMSMKSFLSKLGEDRFTVNVVQIDITEQHEERERLRLSEEFNRLALQQSGNIITRFDVQKRTLTLPDSFNPIFDVPHVLNNMPEEQITLGRVSPDTAHIYRQLFEDIVQGREAGSATYKQNSVKGWRWLEAHYTTIFSSEGKAVSAVVSFEDVTEKLEKEVVYNKWQQSLDERPEESYALFRCNLSKDAAFDSWEGTLLKVNFGEGEKTFDQCTAEYVEQCLCEEDRERYLAFINSDTMLAEYYRGHRSNSIEYREKDASGEKLWRRLTVDLVEYPSSKDVEAYLMFEDIDEQKKADLFTLERSETDPLTGIFNRATFIEKMEQLMRESKPGEKHALFMLDVDNFKKVNDALGHGAGDKVLIDLTTSIGSILRHDDLVGRLGGDEFFVFLKNIHSAEAAEAKARQICQMKISEQGGDIPVTASIGIAMIPNDGNDFDTLYKKVDAALYRQKARGKNGYLFVDE